MGHCGCPFVGFAVQDWITAGFHLREQSLHSSLFLVTPIINHFESTRVLVPKLRTTLKDVEIEGSLPVISATAGTREEYALRSLTGESPQLLKDMEFFRVLFYSRRAKRFLESRFAYFLLVLCPYYNYSACKDECLTPA